MSSKISNKSAVAKRKTAKRGNQNKETSLITAANRPSSFGSLRSAVFMGFGFPDRLKCTLKYRSIGMAFSGVSPAAQVFRMNSLFDPDLTNAGHQPQEFDQLSAVYGQYCVVGSVLKAEVQCNANVDFDGVACYCDANTSSNTVQTLGEGRWALTKVFGESQGIGSKNFHLPPVAHSVIQGQKELESDPNNYCAVSTNPTDVVFGIHKYEASDGVASMAALVSFTLEFQCIFKEKTDNTSSLMRIKERRLEYIKYLEAKEVSSKEIVTKLERLKQLKSQL